MKKIQYQCPHLGAYIAELQYAVPVDGHLLSEAALARRARMSKTTVENVKKGLKSIFMPTMPLSTSIWKPVVTARFFRWSVSSTGFTPAWKPTAWPASTTDAVVLQDRSLPVPAFIHCATLAPRKLNYYSPVSPVDG